MTDSSTPQHSGAPPPPVAAHGARAPVRLVEPARRDAAKPHKARPAGKRLTLSVENVRAINHIEFTDKFNRIKAWKRGAGEQCLYPHPLCFIDCTVWSNSAYAGGGPGGSWYASGWT